MCKKFENNCFRHPDTSQGTNSFDILIVPNLAPILNESSSDIILTIDRANTVIHSEHIFSDPENDPFSVVGSLTSPLPFISYDNDTRTFTSSPTSSDIGTYQFEFTAYDIHNDTGNTTLLVLKDLISNSLFYNKDKL